MTKLKNFITRRWRTASGETRECYYYQHHRGAGGLESLGTDYSDAIRRYAQIIGTPVEQAPPSSVAAIHGAYMAWAQNRTVSKLSPRTVLDRQGYWRHLGPVFGLCDIDTLEPGWMFDYFEARSSQVSAKKELKYFQTLCHWARARGKMRGPDPFHGIMRQMEVDEKREIYVHDAWLTLVHKHATSLVRDAMEFALLFACRPGEIETATARDIEGDELVIKLHKTKR
ncbi:MAG: hypothetical protein M0R02_12990, partial [Bacteroidales bacterium]|nr:hypothetical protein [Bacteroidales bacterium]